MLEECVIRCRSAKRFEERYLRKGFDEQISVIRILDSRREKFRLSKAYEQKIDVVNVITAPEIEMLIIHAEGAYDQFKRSGKKPSEFCKTNLRMHDVKSYDFVKQHFSNPQLLVKAIKEYRRTANIPKQKFIGQIMTSKSPVRSCEDVDEAALTSAEVKALATGNPYIKEKMDLDIQVSKLKLMKAKHTSQKYRLEDNIAKHYPQQITILKERISGMQTDIQTAKANLPVDKEQFSMKVGDKLYME